MSCPYTAVQIQEIVRAHKILRHPAVLNEGKPIPFESYDQGGKRITLDLDIPEIPGVIALRFHVRAPIFDNPESYEAALLLANERVRGVGWDATGKRRLYKVVIPKGWHQNVIDPNLSRNHDDFNRHLPLEDFETTDLADFFLKAAALWHIELPNQKGLFP